MKRKTLVFELMNERINYGGMWATRHEVYKDVFEIYLVKSGDKGTAHRCAEAFAFGPKAVTLTDAECALRTPFYVVKEHEEASNGR